MAVQGRRLAALLALTATSALTLTASGGGAPAVGDTAPALVHGALFNGAEIVPNQVIVRFAAGTTRAERSSAVRAQGATVAESLALPRTQLVELPEGTSVEEAITAFEDDPDVAYAEPNYVYEISAIPERHELRAALGPEPGERQGHRRARGLGSHHRQLERRRRGDRHGSRLRPSRPRGEHLDERRPGRRRRRRRKRLRGRHARLGLHLERQRAARRQRARDARRRDDRRARQQRARGHRSQLAGVDHAGSRGQRRRRPPQQRDHRRDPVRVRERRPRRERELRRRRRSRRRCSTRSTRRRARTRCSCSRRGTGASTPSATTTTRCRSTPATTTTTRIVCVAATDQNDVKASFSNFGPSSVDLGAPGVGDPQLDTDVRERRDRRLRGHADALQHALGRPGGPDRPPAVGPAEPRRLWNVQPERLARGQLLGEHRLADSLDLRYQPHGPGRLLARLFHASRDAARRRLQHLRVDRVRRPVHEPGRLDRLDRTRLLLLPYGARSLRRTAERLRALPSHEQRQRPGRRSPARRPRVHMRDDAALPRRLPAASAARRWPRRTSPAPRRSSSPETPRSRRRRCEASCWPRSIRSRVSTWRAAGA